jgi:hypothetical protein
MPIEDDMAVGCKHEFACRVIRTNNVCRSSARKKSSGSQRDSPRGGGLHPKLNATITADDARRGHRCGYKCLNVVPRSATAPWCRQYNGPVRYHLLRFSCTSQTQDIPSSPKHAPCTVRSCQHGGPAEIHRPGMDRAHTSSYNCDQNMDAGRSVEDPSVETDAPTIGDQR